MARPTALPIFGTAQTNQTVPSGGLQSAGYADGAIPTAKNINYLLNLIYLWINWLFGNVATITRNTFPKILTSGGWLYQIGGSGAPASYHVTATGTLYGDLDIPFGYKLSTMTFGLSASAANSGTLVINFIQNLVTVNPVTFMFRTFASGSLPTVLTDQTLNFLASTNLVASVTVNAAGGTYTRTTGSFLTDGFWVGQQIQWSGFSNGGNNVIKTITALSATVMTVSTTGLVNETAVALATCNGVSPTVDATFGWAISYAFTLVTGGSFTDVGILRYTCVPQ